MATTIAPYKVIAAGRLAEGDIVRRTFAGTAHEYKVVGIIRETRDRKTYTFAQCEPVGDAPRLGMAVYGAKTKPVIKVA